MQNTKNSRRWNRLISTAPTIMKKFILEFHTYLFHPKVCERTKELMTVERIFTRARIFSNNYVGDRRMDEVERLGESQRFASIL